MGRKQRLFLKASLAHRPPNDFLHQSKMLSLPCPLHRISPPWERDDFPRPESLLNPNKQLTSAQLPLRFSHKIPSMPAPSLWNEHQGPNTGQLPYLKHEGMIYSPKKYHTNAFGLTSPPDFRTKATVEYPTSSKKVVIPPLVPIHRSRSSIKLKHYHGITSGIGPLPKISSGCTYQGKRKLPFLKHQPQPLTSSNCQVARTRPVKRKSFKNVNEPIAPFYSHESSSSVPTRENNKAFRRRQLRIKTALLGGLDLWRKDVARESTTPEDHSDATDLTSDQLVPIVQPHPETPVYLFPFLKSPLSEKEQPILSLSETIIISLSFNSDKPAVPSSNNCISRGTNTYLLWPQDKSITPSPNHQSELNHRTSPDFISWCRAKSLPCLPLEICEISMPQAIVTWPDCVAEVSPDLDYKVKDTFGSSAQLVLPVIPLPESNQSGEIPPDLNDQATDPLELNYCVEVSRGQGHQESISMRQSNLPEAASISKSPSATVLSLLTESIPSPGLLGKSSLTAGDHRFRDPFGFDQHIKAPVSSHTWLPPSISSKQSAESIIGLDFQALLELDNESTHELKPDSQVLCQPNPNDQVIYPPISDHQSEPAPDDKTRITLLPDSDHWVKMSLRPDDQISHPPFTNKLDKVESKSIRIQGLPPIDLEDQIKQILPLFNPKGRVTSSSGLSDQKNTPTGNGYHALTFDYQDEAQSRLQYQKPIVRNKEIPWRLKYIKPYTIEGGTLSAETVRTIINSIPEKKIKSDMCKQILLRRMKESPPQMPGQRMSLSYTVCLECASWVPNGCPHVEVMNHLHEIELLVIPMPLPDTEEMGVKFVLRVPEKKPFSFFSMLFPTYEMFWPSRHLSDNLPSLSDSEPRGYPKVTRLCPSISFSETEPTECPKDSFFDVILGKNWQPSESESPSYQLSLIDKILTENEDKKEKLGLLRKGFKSLLEKFEKQMKNC